MLKMEREAGGISKEERADRRRSMVRACWMTKLCWWEWEVTRRIPDAQMGSIRMMHFSSSTLWTVESLHRFIACGSEVVLLVLE